MIKEAILSLSKKQDLTSKVMEQVMDEIMNNEATDAQKASFLTALAMKGETIDEITAAAKVMRKHCEKFLNDQDVLEIVGTGGDGSNTFNISTAASIVTSAVLAALSPLFTISSAMVPPGVASPASAERQTALKPSALKSTFLPKRAKSSLMTLTFASCLLKNIIPQ